MSVTPAAAPRRGWRALVLPSFSGFRPGWLRSDLARTGIELVVANGIGQVRDVLRKAGAHDEPPIYPTIDAALDALVPGAGGFTHNG